MSSLTMRGMGWVVKYRVSRSSIAGSRLVKIFFIVQAQGQKVQSMQELKNNEKVFVCYL